MQEQFFQSRYTMLPVGERSHDPCGGPDDLSYRAIGVPFEGAPLPPSSQVPVSAMLDKLLWDRLQSSAVEFFAQLDLVDPVLREATALLTSMWEERLFCTNASECTVSVHDLRIRVFEPLVKFVLKQYDDKTGEAGTIAKEDGWYLLQYRPEDPTQTLLPRGITFALRHTHTRPDLFAREDECKFFLHERGPIPLDPSGRSHGAQAMLNKLAWRMHSAVQRNAATGQVEVPVRFGLIMSTRLAILAESVENPNNSQECGLLYTPIFRTVYPSYLYQGEIPFSFQQRSVSLMFLASILDYVMHTPGPSSGTLDSLFGARQEPSDPHRDGQSLTDAQPAGGAVSKSPSAIPSDVSKDISRSSYRVRNQPTPYPNLVDAWRSSNFIVKTRLNTTSWPPRFGFVKLEWRHEYTPMEAVVFEVGWKTKGRSKPLRYKPSRRLSQLSSALLSYLSEPLVEEDGRPARGIAKLSDQNKVKFDSLPRLEAVQLLGKGGFASVTAGQLKAGAPADNDKTSDGDSETRRTSIPTDQPVVIKLLDDDVHTEAGIRESIFYETVFPLLLKETRAFLPHSYGTYRSSGGRTLVLIMGYAGNPIPFAERSDDNLQQQIW
ncbi:hypothetical protein MVLG_00498 [Microbotryum lychnidis-dioicae p1A1 Lamole]|uniref:Protein kinase domain-containing protein n=1 Tax=Microbotryum lychnidis-dioicae (strain p1A1 Lamole / MvSl-1064) TaxID=683840 RepID=U5GZ94_USTV1|nr:hypothetical protein MVLG_00498 [Microbotryum lychnidis-dioicae p1A1 Lamole]|eukprot:KDE09176.1 hypothetical protein MVLG_00498 [Microbotryum lychnidis-dioicae p1A1 Lamole]